MQQHILQRRQASRSSDFPGRFARLKSFFSAFAETRFLADTLAEMVINNLHEPPVIEQLAARMLPSPVALRAMGTIERRVLVLRIAERYLLCSVDLPLLDCLPPAFAQTGHPLPDSRYTGEGGNGFEKLFSTDFPRVHLVALYHPENFPLPRFSLAISDIARSLRRHWLASVTLQDMQLETSVQEVAAAVRAIRPDVLGISATFGQYDVLMSLMELCNQIEPSPLTIFGGSLSVRIADILLDQYPDAAVGLGDGERTMRRVVELSGESRRLWDTIPALRYRLKSDNAIVSTSKLGVRTQEEMMPELDLLKKTLDVGGVMQLESSRGCSYACSFCPRDHKGVWVGDDPHSLKELLPYVAESFEGRTVARRIFLVDEEFIGYRPDDEALPRVAGTASLLREHGFSFETSSRLDQIWRRNRDRQWHIERFAFWRKLTDKGLDRCLFGIESGVDSILKRYNKKTTSDQVVYGLRAMSALGIPNRLTYITFDQLMSIEELVETYLFLSRLDLMLPYQADLKAEEVYDLIVDDNAVHKLEGTTPMYEAVSYMMVTMEALIGAPYTQQLEQENLAGIENPLMGRREARFRDDRIGIVSDICQRWIDRNFSLDYLLKSLEKRYSGDARHQLRQLRTVLKRHAHSLLGSLIFSISGSHAVHKVLNALDVDAAITGDSFSPAFTGLSMPSTGTIKGALGHRFDQVVMEINEARVPLARALRNEDAYKLDKHVGEWATRAEWGLINDIQKIA